MAESDTKTVIDTAPDDTYKESDEHVPDPTANYGTLDTSGTAGAQNERIEHISPVFDAARAQDLQRAARAVDPNDTEVPSSEVVNEGAAVTVTTSGGRTPEAGEQAVKDAAAAYQDEPVKIQDPSITDAEEAKDDGSSTDPGKVETQQKAAAATGDNKGSSRTKADPKK